MFFYIADTMDNVNLGGLDPRKAELLEARFYGRVCSMLFYCGLEFRR
jgi:hypothetical protein